MKKKLIAGLVGGVVALGLSLGTAVPANAAGIELWQFNNYSGDYLGDFGTGTSYVGSYADNRASSLKVGSGATYAVLHQFRDYAGKKTGQFYTGSPNLGSWNFDNLTSSIS